MKHSEENLNEEELNKTFTVSVKDLGGILLLGHELGEASFRDDPRMPFFMIQNKINRNLRAVVRRLEERDETERSNSKTTGI